MGVKLRERPGKGWWVFIHWRGQRKAKSFKTKRLAESFATKLEARLKWAEASGEPMYLSRPDRGMPTVEEYLREWQAVSSKPYCKESTQEEYDRAIQQSLIPVFGGRRLGTLTREDIRRFVADQKREGKSLSTIRNYLVPLKAAYFQAMDDGLVPANPVARQSRLFRGQGRSQQRPSPLNREEVEVLLATAKDRFPLLYPLLLCVVRAGLRQGELIGLEWDDVNLRGRSLEVQRSVVRRRKTDTKSKRIRRVEMSPQLTDTLQRLKETRQLHAMAEGTEMPKWVFLSPQGCCWDAANLKRAWRRCLDASGLRHTTFHGMRHSFVSLLIEQGAPPKYIQEQAGHGSIQMTMDIYGHVFPNRNRGWVDTLDQSVDKGDSEKKSATQPQPKSGVEQEVSVSV